MTTSPSTPAIGTEAAEELALEKRAARIRIALIVVAVLAVLGFALAIFLAVREEGAVERWDILGELRREMEPSQDPIWNNPYGLYNPERERYIAALEKFLDTKASEEDDALTPQTRFLLAKTVADHILSNPGLLDMEARSAFYAKGAAQLEALRDKHPDFPLNWSKLSSEGFPSLTRQFLDWFRENEKWEAANLLASKEPSSGVRVLFRTERGDMLLGLFTEDAPKWTAAFIERVTKGYYDGTAFVLKEEVGDVAEPEEHYVAGGFEESRDALAAFEVKAHKTLADATSRAGELPEEARNRIPHDRGTLAAWHESTDEYDHATRFLIAVQRSPRLDYGYTPVGKLVDENGIESLLCLDRIFGGPVWREDEKVRNDTDMTSVLSYFQAPVKIVKALVYRDGNLLDATGDALPTKAAVEDSEKRLASIKVDRYKVEPPAKPGDEAPGDDDGGDEAPLPPLKDDDEDKDDDGK